MRNIPHAVLIEFQRFKDTPGSVESFSPLKAVFSNFPIKIAVFLYKWCGARFPKVGGAIKKLLFTKISV